MIVNPLLLTDGYKLSHREQYPQGTEEVYSNWIPRKSRIQGVDEVVFTGLSYFIENVLLNMFNQSFFNVDEDDVVQEYQHYVEAYMGGDDYDVEHIRVLHQLGYLPLEIRALPEGTAVPIGVPMFTVRNTLPEFFWLTNYLETLFSCYLWGPSTSATIAKEYRKILDYYARKTSSVPEMVDWQGHDFSMRGMYGAEAAIMSGMGHSLFFNGSDTVPVATVGAPIGSVPATEHSVMSAGGKEDEIETFRRLLKTYPTGILSVVSDTWDLWTVVTEYLPALKDEIMARDGKLVIRPDSGDPANILCGDIDVYPTNERTNAQFNGVVRSLYDIFGGTTNDKGYIELDPHIGVIYGDAITLERCENICHRLEQKRMASTNVVFGIGSYTYQYNTRDTFGFAMKATSVVINGERRDIFKDPITDSGEKKSLKGLARVFEEDGTLVVRDQQETFAGGLMEVVFNNGKAKLTPFNKIKETAND